MTSEAKVVLDEISRDFDGLRDPAICELCGSLDTHAEREWVVDHETDYCEVDCGRCGHTWFEFDPERELAR